MEVGKGAERGEVSLTDVEEEGTPQNYYHGEDGIELASVVVRRTDMEITPTKPAASGPNLHQNVILLFQLV